MTELKTLKDLPHYNFEGVPMKNGVAIDERNLKAEAVKWIKEDLYHFKRDGLTTTTQLRMVKQWMKRFNLTEEDLCSEEIK